MITDGEAREIASYWHGGQRSPLYSFSSSGFISSYLKWDVEQALKEAKNRNPKESHDEDYENNVNELEQLLEYVSQFEIPDTKVGNAVNGHIYEYDVEGMYNPNSDSPMAGMLKTVQWNARHHESCKCGDEGTYTDEDW